MAVNIVIPPTYYKDNMGPPSGSEAGQITFGGRESVASNQNGELSFKLATNAARLSNVRVELRVDGVTFISAAQSSGSGAEIPHGYRFDHAAAAAHSTADDTLVYRTAHAGGGEDWRTASFSLAADELRRQVTSSFRVRVDPAS